MAYPTHLDFMQTPATDEPPAEVRLSDVFPLPDLKVIILTETDSYDPLAPKFCFGIKWGGTYKDGISGKGDTMEDAFLEVVKEFWLYWREGI